MSRANDRSSDSHWLRARLVWLAAGARLRTLRQLVQAAEALEGRKRMNVVILIGEVASEVRVRPLDSGQLMASCRVCTLERYERDGEQQQKQSWHNVVAWGKHAQTLSQLHEGDRMMVQGRLQTRSYENKDGQKVYTTEVVARDIETLGANMQVQAIATLPAVERDNDAQSRIPNEEYF